MKLKSVYLVAKYYAKPKNPKNTRFAGYTKDENNMAWDEQVVITYGLKNKDLDTSKIILNINEQKVVKNSFKNGRSFLELFQYFYEANPQQISQGLQQLGITIGKPDDGLQKDVPAETQASEGSEPSTPTDVIGASERTTISEGSNAGESVAS